MPDAEIKESFARCEATGDFAATFYDIFLNASPDIAPYFEQTDFDKQRRLLRGTVYILVTRDIDDAKARETLTRIGRSHSRTGLDVRPELYDIWLDSVCATVRQLDGHWSPALDRAWRDQLRPGIVAITALY